MKIHIFGCLSGTEPMPGKHHTAWALEKDDVLYWFDAGSGCGNTAHLMGLDVRKIRRIFISHSHIEHTGGLPHLLSVVRKRIERDPDGPGAEIEINALLGTPGIAGLPVEEVRVQSHVIGSPPFHVKRVFTHHTK